MMRRCGIALALLIALGACHREGNPTPAPVVDDLAARRTRALVAFEHAALLKPSDESAEQAALAYAPIIVHKLEVRERMAPDGEIGALIAEPGDGYHVERGRTVVYAVRSHAELYGQQYAQWVYHWWYAGDGSARWRWLRITLDRDGFPQIWETLSAGAGRAEIYVAQRLESMAREQYGEPAAGCTFAIERPPDDAPAGAVVRVLNDGPVPMGPFVYLDADRVFTTVLCRCMPSQIRTVGGNGHYELWPITRLPGIAPSADTLFLPQPCIGDSPRLFEMADPRFLEDALRLPVAF